MSELIQQKQKSKEDDPTQPLVIPKPEELQEMKFKVDELNIMKKEHEEKLLDEIDNIQDEMEKEKHKIKVLKLKLNMKN